jgi:hypothetical protein
MNQRRLYRFGARFSKRLKGTTRHFRENVRVFSRAVVLARSSQVRRIAAASGGRADSQRRRLQRFVAQAQPMRLFFVYWVRQVLELAPSRTVVLVVDDTTIGGRVKVMVVGLAFSGRCIPLVWRVFIANCAAGYPAEGQSAMIAGMLALVKQGMPRGKRVRVLADRGIGTSPALMRAIIDLKWTFLFRVTRQSKLILPDGQEVTFYDQVQQAGESYAAAGLVFKKRGRIPAQVRVLWGAAAKARWALVTNDDTLTGWEYAQRMWIEEAFRDLKSHGWQVEEVRWTDPERMARLWIFLVVAYAWMLLLGAVREALGLTAAPRNQLDPPVRRWSLFHEGRMAYLTSAPPT